MILHLPVVFPPGHEPDPDPVSFVVVPEAGLSISEGRIEAQLATDLPDAAMIAFIAQSKATIELLIQSHSLTEDGDWALVRFYIGDLDCRVRYELLSWETIIDYAAARRH